MARKRIQQAVTTGAEALVSACQQCRRMLSNAARVERLCVRVKDITELVLEALD